MERIKKLNRYQKGVLIAMMIMVLAFAAAYAGTISRVGFEYMDTILVRSQESGGTVYSGKIMGRQARFTVSEDKTVVFEYGDKSYGPYTAKEDPTAIPKDMEDLTGVELRQGEDILFRGGVLQTENSYWLYQEDGTLSNFGITYTTGDGIERDEHGNIVDPAEPSASDILMLMNDPVLTHKGAWSAWLVAAFICLLNALLILFADELFRLNMALQIRNADRAEPSDWEIAGRYIAWTAFPIIALVLFVMGLR